MNNITELLESLSRNSNHPQDAFSKFYEFVNETIGLKLLTLTTFDISNAVAQRVYSNMPIEYPVSGIKPIEKSTWTEIVLDNHKSFIANNIENNAVSFIQPIGSRMYSERFTPLSRKRVKVERPVFDSPNMGEVAAMGK